MQTADAAPHGLTLANRSHADVDCFNEQLVVLMTTLGTMTISGSAMNLSHMNKEEGRIIIDGEFDSIEYSGKARGRGGFLAKLLR